MPTTTTGPLPRPLCVVYLLRAGKSVGRLSMRLPVDVRTMPAGGVCVCVYIGVGMDCS